MRIVKLQTENIKKLVAVEITPAGDVVRIEGKNDAGKSSVLDSIAMALGGASLIPGQPVRKGQKTGKVTVDLGEIVVTRTITAAGGGSLIVENKDGARFKSPQAMLDNLLGALTFDPLAFEREEPKAQAEILRKLVGLDTKDLDDRRAVLYDERTLKNREVKALAVNVDALVTYDKAPDVEVSIVDLLEEAKKAEALQAKATAAQSQLDQVRTKQRLAQQALVEAKSALELARKAFAAADQRLQDTEASVASLAEAEVAFVADTETALAAVPDTEAIRQRLAEAEGINAQVRTNAQAKAAREMLEDAKADSEGITRQIDQIDTDRAARIAAVAFPVPGLTIAADGAVLLDDLPFEQASTSARLRVSVAIGLAMNSKLRVLLIRDGSLLDSSNLKLIAEMAEAAGAQVWIEMMAETPSSKMAVYIEDGAVRA